MMSSNRKYGTSHSQRTVVSSTLTIRPGLPLGTHFRRRGRNDLGIAVDVLEPEDEIVGGERRAVGPFHALAQMQRVGLAVVAEVVALGDAGHDLAAVRAPVQRLVGRLDAVAVLAIRGAGERAPPGAAVFADLVQRLPDHRFGRNALLDRRQFAGFHQLRQHRRLVELLRPLRRIGDHRRALQLADQTGLRQAGLRLRYGAAQEFHCRRAGGKAGQYGAAR